MASADEVKVSLKTVAGKQFVLTATDSTTIGTLKEKLSTEHDLDEVGMKLVYKGKVTENTQTLTALSYDPKATFMVVAKRKNSFTSNAAKKARTENEEKEKERAKAPQPSTPPPQPVEGSPQVCAPARQRVRAEDDTPTTDIAGMPQDALLRQLEGHADDDSENDLEDLNQALLLAAEGDYSDASTGSDPSGDVEIHLDEENLERIGAADMSEQDMAMLIHSCMQAGDGAAAAVIRGPEGTTFRVPSGRREQRSEEGAAAGAGSAAAEETSEDKAAIQRLMDLAQVDEDSARQAYLAMGKNEEAAANLLFD